MKINKELGFRLIDGSRWLSGYYLAIQPEERPANFISLPTLSAKF
jgi:hypothetical protein